MKTDMESVLPQNLTVLVTGATAGIGEATVKRLHAAGCRVIAAGRRRDRLERLRLEMDDGRFHAVQVDVGRRDSVIHALAELPAGFREIDVLVNNAGAALGLEPAHRANWDDWDAMVDTNVRGVMNCVRAILPGMCERDRGHIVNIGSVSGRYPYPGGNVYAATKAFIEHFSLNLRADLLGHNVRVTNIEPGRVQTEVSLVRFKGDKLRAAEPYSGFQPLRPFDIAETIFWCVTLPRHVNINRVEVMPIAQAFNPLKIHRSEA
jgi:3-hydroxy acid dehydrogenase / malonic semialdehyde reductase